MHVFFSGIGGTAIGPLALIAKQAGYEVSGSDKRDSSYIQYLRKQGIDRIHIGQTKDRIEKIHQHLPIDWYVYSSAITLENPDAPELQFCTSHSICATKRDELLNKILSDKHQKLVAISGTHGKTTTTAMLIWLMQQLQVPISWSVGAKIIFGEMGNFDATSEYFVYEADEFDRNFLAFQPELSIITGIDYDHHEIFPTLDDYQQAFRDFLDQSKQKLVWESDIVRAQLVPDDGYTIIRDDDPRIDNIKLGGKVNRQNAWQVVSAAHQLTDRPIEELAGVMNGFPGLSRRFEQLSTNLYTDYAHTIEKVRGCLQTAYELSSNVVVVYEPLTNRRQHYIKKDYANLFDGVKKLYWLPSYLAREDPNQELLSPRELIDYMQNKHIAQEATLSNDLWVNLQQHLAQGDLVVCISGGGGDSLDEWIREQLALLEA